MAFIVYVVVSKVLLCCISAQGIDTIDVQRIMPINQTEKTTGKQITGIDEIEIHAKHLSNRSSFAGIIAGKFRPHRKQSSKPWLFRPQLTSTKPHIIDSIQEISKQTPSTGFIWSAKPSTTSTIPPLVRPTINFISEDSIEPAKTPQPKPEKTTSYLQLDNRFKETTQFPYTEVIEYPSRPSPNRPFYAGQTGGNYHPQLIPPGKPWPARPEDYVTSYNSQSYTRTSALMNDHITQTSFPMKPFTDQHSAMPDNSHNESSTGNESVFPNEKPFEDMFEEVLSQEPTRPPPNRPPFAGLTSGNFKPQIIPAGEPGPAKPNEDKILVTTSKLSDKEDEESTSEFPIRPPSKKPQFSGDTGDNFRPQIIFPVKPLPSKPIEDMIEKTTSKPFQDMFEEVSKEPTRPPLNRPPFVGITSGNSESDVISYTEVIEYPSRPIPNRPFYAGQTGGNYHPQLVPPGKPWPARPEDYVTSYNSQSYTTSALMDDHITQTSFPMKPFTDQHSAMPDNSHNESSTGNESVFPNEKPFEDMFEEVLSQEPTRPPPNRPPFAGLTSGNFKPQIIPAGEPGPAKPNEDKILVTTSKLSDKKDEESTSEFPIRPPSKKPQFSGDTGDNFRPQITFPVKPLPSKPIEDIIEKTTSKPFQDMFEEISKEPTRPPLNRPPFSGITGGNSESDVISYTEVIEYPSRPLPNRPFYAGQTGGNYHPQLIPPGKPWPARPEDYVTSNNYQPFTTTSVIMDDHMKQTSFPMKPLTSDQHSAMPDKLHNESQTVNYNSSSPHLKPITNISNDTSNPLTNKSPQNFLDHTSEHSVSLDRWTSTIGSPSLTNKPLENVLVFPNEKPFEEMFEEVISQAPTRPPPNRPPFAGLMGGNFEPQIVLPGEPWPARLNEDKIVITTSKSLEDMIAESSFERPSRPPSKKPQFAEDNYVPQLISSPKPLPSNHIEDKPQKSTAMPFEDMFDEVVLKETARPSLNRPPFAVQADVNSKPQIIPSDKPWSATPNKGKFNVTRSKPQKNMITLVTTSDIPSWLPSNGLPFAGDTSGNVIRQTVHICKPVASKPMNQISQKSTPRPFEDTFESLVLKKPTRFSINRPPYAVATSGNSKVHIITSGEPLSAKHNKDKSNVTASIHGEDVLQEVSSE